MSDTEATKTTFGMSLVRFQTVLTKEEQFEALAEMVPLVFVKKNKWVKGPFTTADYVTWKLNQVFTPAGWSFLILEGPQVVNLNQSMAYVHVKGRIEVVFADGATVCRDDVGITPLYGSTASNAPRKSLDDTSPEVHETAEKAAVSDCLKACAERLGLCFRPLIDQDLELAVRAAQQTARRNKGGGKNETAKDAIAALYGPPDGSPSTSSTETPQNGITPPDWADWDEKQWPQLWNAAVDRLKYNHVQHVKNTLKKVFNGNTEQATYEAAWTALVAHQASKAAAEADEDVFGNGVPA